MIFPAKMLRTRMIVFHADSQSLLDALRGKGLFHFSDFSDSPERWKFKGIPNQEEYGELKQLFKELEDTVSLLEADSKKDIVSELFPRVPDVNISEKSIDQIKNDFGLLKTEIDNLEQQKESLLKTRSKLSSHQQAIGLLEDFKKQIKGRKLPKSLNAFFGEVMADELPLILLALEENELDNYVCYKKIRKDEEKMAVLLILADKKDGVMMEKILERHDFDSIELPQDGDDVLSVLNKVKNSISRLDKEELQVSSEIKNKAAAYLGEMHSYMAKVKIEIDMINVKNLLGKTDKTMLIEGWIKEKDRESFEKTVNASTHGRVSIFYFKPDMKKGDIPVALENPGFIKPFEMLTRMFSPPNYNELDPTPFLAVAFVLFFGIMFADILDAMLLFSITFLFYKRFKHSDDAKNLAQILFVCCASALVFGLIGGEFAGFQIWAKHEILQPANLLLFALFLGLVQITVGYVIGAANSIRSRDMQELLGGKVGWLLVMAGALAGFFITWHYAAVSVLGIIMVFAFKGMREVLDLTRLLSNLLSYVRLLALNMAHVGLSATFAGIVGALFSLGITGKLSAAIIIFISHIFLVFVSLVAVFAHALRLQYVEFFSKFYEGGGTIFNPF